MENIPARTASRSRTAVAVAALLAAVSAAGCAQPVTTVTHIEDAPGERVASDVRYGVVRQIDVVDRTANPTPGGAILGGLLGGLLGNQIGEGAGRGAATVLGAFGGAYLGNRIEQNHDAAASQHYYHVVVEFRDGETRGFDYYELNGLRIGERVKLDHGVLDRA